MTLVLDHCHLDDLARKFIYGHIALTQNLTIYTKKSVTSKLSCEKIYVNSPLCMQKIRDHYKIGHNNWSVTLQENSHKILRIRSAKNEIDT